MRRIATHVVAWSVCVSVCLFVIGMNPAKTAEQIEMPFGMWAWVDRPNHVFDGGLDCLRERDTFGGWHTKACSGMPVVSIYTVSQKRTHFYFYDNLVR